MNSSTVNDFQDSFKPLLNMFEIQNRTTRHMLREQMDFVSDCLDINSRHSDALRDGDDQMRYIRVPIDASREVGERWSTALSRQWDILVEARDAMSDEFQSAARRADSTVKQASERAKSTAQQAGKAASDASSSSSSSADKSK